MKTLPYRRRPTRIAARLAATAGVGAMMLAPAATAAARTSVRPAGPAATAPAHVAAATLSSTPVAAMATAPNGGYWLVNQDGSVFSFGGAAFHGTAAPYTLGSPVVGMAALADGSGYWIVTADGGVFSFGNAAFHGSPAQYGSTSPVVGIQPTPTDNGYWIVTASGGIFSFGDAQFFGAPFTYHPAAPVAAMASTPSGHGYWIVTSDGGVFSFGDAVFHGTPATLGLGAPVVGIASSPTGHGYWIATADGGIFNYGDAAFDGAAVTAETNGARAIGIANVGSGYWVPNTVGIITSAGAPVAAPTGYTVYVPPAPVSAHQLPSQVEPATNTLPSTAFGQACWSAPLNAAACDAAALSAIDSARAGEGYGPLTLPANYAGLSMPSQVLAVANAERTSRGLPALPENAYLDLLAAAGASANGGQGTDPTGPRGYGWGSNIAWGDPTALSADFSWMYDDGPGGENIDCTASGQAGCWGHRENILAPWGGASGAGEFIYNGSVQLTQLFVENY